MKNKLIFIGGCGRSGTTWLGDSLSEPQNITLISEKQNIFSRSRLTALNQTLEVEFMPSIIRYYKNKVSIADESNIFVDKSHTNIWFLEELISNIEFSSAILIYRNPYDTVSSMLKHKGVKQPMLEWYKYPIPNRFLGVGHIVSTSEYMKMSLISRCVIRWIAHYERLKELESLQSNKIVIVKYEEFTKKTLIKKRIKKVIDGEFDFKTFSTDSICKYKESLTNQQKKIISDTLSKYCKSAAQEFTNF